MRLSQCYLPTLHQAPAEAKRRDQPREAVEIVPLDCVLAWAQEALPARLESSQCAAPLEVESC